MINEEKPFDFSKLVKLYCENYDVIDTLAKRCDAEMAELKKRIKMQLALNEKEWDLNLSKQWGSLKKNNWSEKTAIHYEFWYEPWRIGRDIFKFGINVSDRTLREKMKNDIGDVIVKTFNPIFNLSVNSFVTSEEKVGERTYSEVMLKSIQKCIDFAPNLDPYAKEN